MKNTNIKYSTNLYKVFNVSPYVIGSIWLTIMIFKLIFSDYSPTVLSYDHKKHTNNYIETVAHSGDQEWFGEFVAKDNYLGILSIQFTKEGNPLFDTVQFMIREKGSAKWYQKNSYDARQFYLLDEFPFGFKPIANSKNKIYEYKFISKTGNINSNNTLQKLDPVVTSKYKYPKELLLENPLLLIGFITNKSVFALSNPQMRNTTLIYSFIFAFWLFANLLWKRGDRFKKFIKKIIHHSYFQIIMTETKLLYTKYIMIWFTLLFTSIFVLNIKNDLISLIITAVWLKIVVSSHMNSKYHFYIVFTLALFMPLTYLMRLDDAMNSLSDWIFYFLLIGVIHGLIDINKIQ